MRPKAANEPSVEDMIGDPTGFFDTPEEVVASSLSADDKRRVLETWETDARRLEESASENMAGGEPSKLRAVLKAQEALARAGR